MACPKGQSQPQASLRRQTIPDGECRAFPIRRTARPGRATCDVYPLVLTVGRYLGQWHTMTRTGMVQRLNDMHPEPAWRCIEDAKAYGVDDNGLAAITSRRGT